jgi:hypothetical protein
MLCVITVFNAGAYLIIQKYFIEPSYSKMDTYISQVRDDKVEITKEKYLIVLEQKKSVYESTDSIIIGYEYIIKALIAVNLFCIVGLCLTWWRDLSKVQYENS